MAEQTKRVLRRVLFGTSVLLNVALAGVVALEKLNAPEDRIGVLTKDLEVGSFSGTATIFRLPKGLTVRDASPRFFAAVGQFEPHRFSIIITSENESVVNYHVARSNLHLHQEYYSAELADRRAVAREEERETSTQDARR